MSEGKGNGKKGPPPRKPRLFEAFVVSAAGPGVAPVMMYCYAPRDANLMQFNAIPEFSFPESGLKLPPSSGEQDEAERAGLRKTFSFVLTGGDGARLHGFCRRYTTAAGTQEAACILTQHCWYDIFCKILDAFQDTACSQAGAAGVATFARNLQAQGLVEPGSAVRVPLEGLRELAFVRPLNTSKCHYDARLCELFRRLPVSKTVMLFFLMLTERRVILLSSDPSRLSDCAHALASLLYPFEWQHIYVPILVPKMLDYVCAPMPFLIGMHIAMLPSLKNMPMEEVVMVDLDRGRLRYNEKDVMHLPDEHFDAMCNALMTSLNAKTGDDRVDWAPLANVFLDFFLSVFSTYRRFITQKDGKALFDQQGFKSSQRRSIVKFLTEFERSQMYEELFAERTGGSKTGDGTAGLPNLDDPFDLALASIAPSGSKSSEDLEDLEKRKGSPALSNSSFGMEDSISDLPPAANPESKESKAVKASRFSTKQLWSSMEDIGRGIKLSSRGSTVYKPAYLTDEAAYIKTTSPHLLSRIYADLGMLEKKDGVAPKAPGLQAPPRKRAAEPEHGGVAAAEKEEYQEHWFGPAAAIKKKGGNGVGGGAAEGDISDKELEMQTRYFKELNDKMRLQAEREEEAAGQAAASDGAASTLPNGASDPHSLLSGAAEPAAAGEGGWTTFAGEEEGRAQITSPALAPRPDVGVVDDMLGDMLELGDVVAAEVGSAAPDGGAAVGDMLGDAVSGGTSSAGAGRSVGRDELDDLFGGDLPPAPAHASGSAPQPGAVAVVDFLS